MITIIAVINLAFFWTTRNAVITKEIENNKNIAQSIKATIENNQEGVELFEHSVAQQLYADSIIINSQLPSDVKQVNSAKLNDLAKSLHLYEIAILVPDKQWFNLVQSTSLIERGTNSKTWGDKWNRRLFQLIQNKNVKQEPNFGEAYPHFWSGPFDSSANIPDEVIKTGYYYDGSKNYIIEPVNDGQQLMNFQNVAGVDSAITRLKKSNPSIMEISLLNFNRLTGNFKINPDDELVNRIAFHSREVIDGTYQYISTSDKNFARKAVNQNKTVYRITNIKGKQVIRLYIPFPIKVDWYTNQDKTVIITTVDYAQISNLLRHQMINLTLVVIFCFIFCFALIFWLFRYIKKQGKLLSDIQDLYAGKVNSLYKTIREYRHDVANHIFTIQGLLSIKNYSEAEKYIKQLSHIHKETSAVVNIHIPAFIGLIQVKMAESIEKNIKFDQYFEGFEYLKLDIEKTANLVKIIGNILNNSFYEVQKKEEGDRSVSITGKAAEKKLRFCIQNNGDMIPPHLTEKIFEFGFTTKKEGSGIGLASAKKAIEQYKGKITVNSNQEWTTFTIDLPLSKREFVPDPFLKGNKIQTV